MESISMGVASGCGCKEVYRFPHVTYPYSSCICSFCESICCKNISKRLSGLEYLPKNVQSILLY